jgi:hypothetical protein
MFKHIRQSGWSLPGVITVLFLATIAVKVAYVVAPPFYDNYLVRQALRDLAERFPNKLVDMSKETANGELSKFYMLNGVRNPDIAKALVVERLKGRTIFSVNYEVRQNFMANLDFVVVFKNALDSSVPEDCCTAREK